jgi:hypothetical protein
MELMRLTLGTLGLVSRSAMNLFPLPNAPHAAVYLQVLRLS